MGCKGVILYIGVIGEIGEMLKLRNLKRENDCN